MNWTKFGNDNTKFFHQSIRRRFRTNRISHLHVSGCDITDLAFIRREFFLFYSNLFCTEHSGRGKINLDIVRSGPIMSNTQRDLLNLSFTKAGIKEALWSIPDDKSPGLDGFNSKF